MNSQFFIKIAPLVKDKMAWDAFLAIIEYEKSQVLHKLKGKPDAEEAIRLSAEFSILDKLTTLNMVLIAAEKNFQ